MASDVLIKTSSSPATAVGSNPWKKCTICRSTSYTFKSQRDFVRHLRDFHCKREGGSFVCRYGPNGLCRSLPIEGVNDQDYEDHVIKVHVSNNPAMSKSSIFDQRDDPTKLPQQTEDVRSEPNVVEDQHKWTVFNSQVNLPAVLNDPRLARRETDFFTKTWGESFDKTSVHSSPHLPDITREHFRRYLKKTTGRLKAHTRLNAPNDEDRGSHPADAFPTLQARQKDLARAELDAIPKIFMHPNFTLENPETFNAVFPWTQVEPARSDSGRKPKQSSKLLQEKLSHYLDLVEVQIARQISLRSEAFFHAVSSHDKLQDNMSNTITAIKTLREKVRDLNSSMVEGPLRIMRQEQCKVNYLKLHNKLKLMSTVHQTQPTIQLLLSTNEFVGALDLISTTQEVLSQELAGVHSFRHLGSQLAEMEKVIDKMMQEDFVRYATTDLNRPLTEGSPVQEEDGAELTDAQERLVAIIFGMFRQHKHTFVDVYREEACTGLKTIIKQTVIEAVAAAEDIDTDTSPGSLADQMRLLNYTQWMDLLQNVFNNLLVLLKRVKNVVEVMLEVAQVAAGQNYNRLESTESEVLYEQTTGDMNGGGAGLMNGDLSETRADEETEDGEEHPFPPAEPVTPTTPVTPSKSIPRISVANDVDVMMTYPEYVKVTHYVREMLCEVCDHAHDRCVKLLVARARDGFLERLSSNEFVRLSRCVEGFVTDGEKVCGRRSTSLRGCLQSQANKFVNRFHEERKTKLSLILDNERWKQADVPTEFQELVKHIEVTGQMGVLPYDRKADTERKPREFLTVGNQKYAVVGTVLMLLKMVGEYCQCVDDIPSAIPDILTRLIELLKMFNSRTCQLILGAGALQLVGLKTITTKNLALASRCLQLVVHFLPKIQEHFESRLQGKQSNMLKHFSHIMKDYNDHIDEISNKLVAIMDSMIDLTLSKWEVKAPMPSLCFRNICKQMSKLHEAITELLPQGQIRSLFERIHKNFKVHLRGQLIKLGVTPDGGPQHGLVMADVAYYTGQLKSLAGLGDIREAMEDVWDQS